MTDAVGTTTEGADIEVAAPVTSLPAVLEIPAPVSAVTPRVAPVVSAAPVSPTPTKASLAETTRLRETLVNIVPHAQYQLTRLGAVGIAGIATLLAAVVITVGALIPGQNAISALDADIVRAMQRPPAEATPEEGLGKLVSALPTRGQMPAVIGLVLQQAQQAGVPLDVGHYAFVPAKTGSVGRYELEFPVRASYPQVRDFINRTLTAVPAAGLDKLRIERKSVADQTVNADVRFVVFVRGE